jgi:hypothetical protein
MKKLSLLIFLPLLVSCEKYVQISEPSIAGKWVFYDYDISIVSSPSDIKIVQDDTVCINNFGLQKQVGDFIYMKQDYSNTSIDRRFIKGKTTWDFDGPNQSTFYPLLVDDKKVGSWVNFVRPYFENQYTSLEVSNDKIGDVTNYTFNVSGLAQNYSRKLTLISPVISTDVFLGANKREKAVNVRIMLYFMR